MEKNSRPQHPALSFSPSHLSSVLINDSITHNFHCFYFKFIFQTEVERKKVCLSRKIIVSTKLYILPIPPSFIP